MTSAMTASAAAPVAGGSLPPFDSNVYRKTVLQPMLASGVVSIEDPFKLIGVDPSCDDTAALAERIDEVVGFWQKERNSPRYKGLVGELVKRKTPIQGMLLDPEKRALARMRVQGTRRAQESARSARLDRLLKAVVGRQGGLPRSRLHLLELLAKREGTSPELLAQKLADVPIIEDGYGVQPLPESVRRQVRSSLDELQMLGDRARSVSLWAFVGLPATSTSAEVQTRHAELVAENQASAHDRAKTITGDLLAQVRAVLFDEAHRASYLVVLLDELRERLTDRVLELGIVDGELWPADVENLVRDAVALGTGLTGDQVRKAVRDTATGLGISMTTGKSSDSVVCSRCQGVDGAAPVGPPGVGAPAVGTQTVGVPVGGLPAAVSAISAAAVSAPSAPAPSVSAVAVSAQAVSGAAVPGAAVPAAAGSPPAVPSAGLVAQAAEEWRSLDREIAQRRLMHALSRAQRLVRLAPELPGPSGQLPQQRLVELVRQTTEARTALDEALAVEALPAREAALYAVLERVPDLEEAAAALASLPLAAPLGLRAVLDGSTMRLTWEVPPGRTMTYAVTRVTRDARGARVEHPLGVTARNEAIDADLPRASLVWHEVVAQLGARRSSPAATDPQPVVPDISDLRAALGPDGVSLTWNAPAGSDVVVERVAIGDADAPMKRLRARGTRWKDTEVEVGTSYRYVVRVEAAVGGVVARTPGCTVEVQIAPPAAPALPTFASAAPPAAAPEPEQSVVRLTVTPVPPGIVASWEAPPGTEVTVFASQASLGRAGDQVSVEDLAQRARVVGFAVGSGTAFDADPGIAAIFTPVSVQQGQAVLGAAVRHVSVGPVESLRTESVGTHIRLRFSLPRGCGEALVVWRRDRPPADPSEAEGGEVVTAEKLASDGGWTVPADDRPAFFHVLVLPVVHLGNEPVFGPGTPLRVG